MQIAVNVTFPGSEEGEIRRNVTLTTRVHSTWRKREYVCPKSKLRLLGQVFLVVVVVAGIVGRWLTFRRFRLHQSRDVTSGSQRQRRPIPTLHQLKKDGMPPRREPLKYLTYYPFSVLAIAKSFILAIYALNVYVWQWNPHPRQFGVVIFVVPVLNLVGCASALISVWFMVQKFYWKRVELSLDLCGVVLSLMGMSILLLNYGKDSSLRNYIAFNHLLVTIGWSFCLFWSRFFTSNNVSNLFINEWGRGTDDIEIEALEEHFYRDPTT